MQVERTGTRLEITMPGSIIGAGEQFISNDGLILLQGNEKYD